MKLGLVSSILDGWTFEEMIDTLSEMGYQCAEAACWPVGSAERRYAGVSHIDVTALDDTKANYILDYCKKKNVEISALAFYPNVMTSDVKKREANVSHLLKVIDASAKLQVNMVTTFIGRDQFKTVEENLELVKEIWPPILEYAQDKKVKIAIENCPMLFGKDQWPGGQNLMTTPSIWEKVFEILPSDYLGLNFDPSHFIWQMMDYINPLRQFKDKIFHVHCKDIKLDEEKLNQVGITAYPLEYMSPKLPGLGDVDWELYINTLTGIMYDGYVCIEIEDKAFEDSREKILESLELSHKYIRQFII